MFFLLNNKKCRLQSKLVRNNSDVTKAKCNVMVPVRTEQIPSFKVDHDDFMHINTNEFGSLCVGEHKAVANPNPTLTNPNHN